MHLFKTKLILFFTIFSIVSLYGQNETEPAKVFKIGLYESPPFVMDLDSEPNGMAIDLWEQIAHDLNIKFEYVPYNTFKEIVEATRAKKIDISVTNLTITEERAQLIDFTQPWYDAGLRIMISETNKTTTSELIKGLKDAGHLTAYLWLIAVILVTTIALTFFDRKFDKEFPKKWREGLAESFYSVMLVATSGSLKRKNLFGWIGKILSAFWLVIGVVFLAYLTSSITSVMTTLSLSNEIKDLNDLNDKNIGVIEGSSSEYFVIKRGFNYTAYPHLQDAVKGLNDKTIDAVIGDAPVLEYYSFTESKEPVKVVGKLFKHDKYGFGLPKKDDFMRPLTIEILKAHENGTIEKLKLKYFGQGH